MHTLQQLLSGELKGSKHLKLIDGLTEFPNEIYSLAESLEVLDLSGNRLSVLPHDFGRLSKLKIVFFSDNLLNPIHKMDIQIKESPLIRREKIVKYYNNYSVTKSITYPKSYVMPYDWYVKLNLERYHFNISIYKEYLYN